MRSAAVAFLILAFQSNLICSPQNNSSIKIDRGSHWMDMSPDAAFAIWSEQRGVAEIELGKLAEQKGGTQVKTFGETTVEEYTSINKQLQDLALDEFMTLPDDVTSGESERYRKLEKHSGPDFDRTYIQDMIKDERSAIKEFQKEVKKGKDKQMVSFASQSLQVLEGQLSRLHSLVQAGIGAE